MPTERASFPFSSSGHHRARIDFDELQTGTGDIEVCIPIKAQNATFGSDVGT